MMHTLEAYKIARPCPARWEEMQGDDRVRLCGLCQKSVYNVAAFTRDEALRLIESRGGGACARLFRRRDGTILTVDCPVGVRAFRKRVVSWLVAGASAISVALGLRARLQPPGDSQPPSPPGMDCPTSRPPVGPYKIDPEILEQLGALGYVDPPHQSD